MSTIVATLTISLIATVVYSQDDFSKRKVALQFEGGPSPTRVLPLPLADFEEERRTYQDLSAGFFLECRDLGIADAMNCLAETNNLTIRIDEAAIAAATNPGDLLVTLKIEQNEQVPLRWILDRVRHRWISIGSSIPAK